jgi:hypothetical protein
MTRGLWLLALSLPLAAQQPKFLINGPVESRAVSANLDQEFRKLVAAGAQPQWIGFSVPSSRNAGTGCNTQLGVVHLEPPEQVVVLFRAEAKAVGQIRVLSADCQIDAGGIQVHWLTGVKSSDGASLLATFAGDPSQRLQRQALSALTAVSDGVPALIMLTKSAPDAAVRKQAMNSLQQSQDPRALQFFEEVLKH